MSKHNRKNVKIALARMESKCAKCGAVIPLGQAHFPRHKQGDFSAYCEKCCSEGKVKT